MERPSRPARITDHESQLSPAITDAAVTKLAEMINRRHPPRLAEKSAADSPSRYLHPNVPVSSTGYRMIRIDGSDSETLRPVSRAAAPMSCPAPPARYRTYGAMSSRASPHP